VQDIAAKQGSTAYGRISTRRKSRKESLVSAKSERKKRMKAEKQSAAAAKVLQMPRQTVRKLYAEDLEEALQAHRVNCHDPNCKELEIGLQFGVEKVVAMLKTGHPKEILLAPFGTNSPEDYQPFASLQLETGDEIRGAFDSNGRVKGCVHADDHPDDPICLTLLCHNKGTAVAIEHKQGPGVFSLRCAVCNTILSDPDLAIQFKLAPRPKPEYPNIFCKHHGIEPAFAVCPHVLDGAYPELLLPPDEENAGEAYCAACAILAKESRYDEIKLEVICRSGLDKRLGGNLRAILERDAA
jgi:hypothetical protein